MAQRNHRYFSVIVEPEDEPGDDGPPAPGYGASVGDVLRHARQQTGYALSDVAEVLRIRLRYLEAIEDGRFDDLPGSVYAVGFIRAYAEFLGLDTDEMVRRFKDEVAGIDRQTELHFPEPVAEGRVPGGAILLIAVVLAAVAYGGWFYMSSDNRSFDDMIPQMPERFAALLSSEPAVQPPSDTPADSPAGAGAPVPDVPSGSAGTDTPATTDPSAVPPADPASRGTDLAESGDVDVPAPAIVPPADVGGEAAAPTAADTARSSIGADAASGATGPATAGSPAGPGAEVGTAPSATAPVGDGSGAPDAGGATDTAAAPAQGPSDAADDATGGPAGDRQTIERASPSAPGPAADEGADPATSSGAGPAETDIAASPPRPGASAAQAAADPAARVVLQATADSWVQVRDGSGNLVMTRVLRPGDVYEVPDRPGLTLVTGNAGGLDILVDGRTVPPLGEQGEVVRDISLDARTLMNGTP